MVSIGRKLRDNPNSGWVSLAWWGNCSGVGRGLCWHNPFSRDLKQPRRRTEWTPTESVLTKPATSVHVSDVIHMAFRAWHLLICRPQVNVSIQSSLCRFCAHFTLFNTNVWKKETFFVLFVEGWAVGGKDFERFSVNREPWFSMASVGKNPWVKVKVFMFSLNSSEFPEALFNCKEKGRWYSGPLHDWGWN